MGQTVTIGTSTTTSHYAPPIDNFYNYSFTEMLFAPSEIAAGNPQVNTIISLGFNTSTGNNGWDYDITVYMKNVDDTEFGTAMLAVSNDDVYFEGNVGPVAANSWMTFDLDRAFTYDPTKTLLIAVNKTAGHGSNSYQYPGNDYKWNYTATTNNTVVIAHTDGSVYSPVTSLPSPSTIYGWSKTNRPNTQIVFGAPATCPKPTLSPVAEADIQANSAIIRWTPSNEDQTLFDIYWSTANTNPTDATIPSAANQSGTSYEIPGLNAATQYYVWIRGICNGTEYTGWTAAQSFTTACGTVGPGYTCGFEGPNTGGTSSYPLPACWTRKTEQTSTPYPYVVGYSYYEGSKCLYFNSSNNASAREIAVMPEIAGGVSGKRVSFYQQGAYSFSVGYMTDPDDFDSFEPIYTKTGTSSYALHEVDFGDYTGSPRYIAFKSNFTGTYQSIYIDKVTLSNSPTCFKPTMNTTATNVGPTTATVSWTAGGTNQDRWDVYYSSDYTAPTSSSEPQVQFTADNPCILTGLTPSTPYRVWVRGNCGTQAEPDYSEWSSDFCSFTTPAYCADMQVQSSTINFTNLAYNTVTVNWTAVGAATAWKVQCSTTSSFDAIASEKTVTATTATLDGLTKETLYYVRIAPYCDEAGEYTPWSSNKSFTTTESCPAPVLAAASNPTAHGATFTWTGTSETYNLMAAKVTENTLYGTDFESGIPSYFTNDATHAWEITTADKHAGNYSVKSTGEGTAYLQTDLTLSVSLTGAGTVSFWAKVSSESNCDYGRFLIDDSQKMQVSGQTDDWTHYEYTLTSGDHTLVWRYKKDINTDKGDDCFYVDDIAVIETSVGSWQIVQTSITENTVTVSDATKFDAETTYQVKVVGICPWTDEQTDSNVITFTTSSSCETPDGLQESEVTYESAKITWNTHGLTTFNLRYKAEGDANWIVKNNVGCPDIITDLTDNTLYHVQVQTTCGNEEWSTALDFYTECNVKTVDLDHTFSEHFDATDFPRCWDNPQITIGSTNYKWNRSTLNHTTTSGSGSAYSGYYGPIYLMLPELAIGNDATDVKLNFWARLDYTGDYDGTTAKSSVVLINGLTETELWTYPLDGITELEDVWKDYSINLSAYKGQTIQLAFKYEGNNDHGWYIDDVEVAFDPTCFPVGTLTYNNLGSTKATLSWPLVDDTQTLWEVAYKAEGDADFTIEEADTNENYLLEGLTAETTYTVKVRANCGATDGTSQWSNEITFTTLVACPVPTLNAATNITAVGADITWDASLDVDNYTVQYLNPMGATALNEGFENDGGWPTGWDNSVTTNDSYKWAVGAGSGYSSSTVKTAATGDYNAYYYTGNYGKTATAWLITPAMDLSGMTEAKLTFNYVNPEWGGGRYELKVNYRVDGGEWQLLETYNTGQSSWTLKTITLAGMAANYQIGFSVTGYDAGSGVDYGYGVGIDDVKVFEVNNNWTTAATDVTIGTYTLSTLDGGNTYDVRVKPNCIDEWSNVITFTTLAEGNMVFTNATADGKWGTAGNWVPAQMPVLTDEVIIRANATIESNCVAAAKKITFEGSPTPTLTIADGGQLQTNTAVNATVKKTINAYPTEGTAGYYLIGNPLSSTIYSSGIPATGMTTGSYDLYQWNYTASDGLEWRNYEASTFSLYNAQGYLYANAANTELTFTGSVLANNTEVEKTSSYTDDYVWKGWSLWANPFVCNAYITSANVNLSFYRMNADGSGFEAATGAIAPMEGIFVQATGTNQKFKFTRTAPDSNSGQGNLNINLTEVVTTRDKQPATDNAIICFGGSSTLEKFSFRANSTKVYIPMEGKDYAVVNAGKVGEIPVSFKAEKNGSYSLSFTSQEVSFSYLHLIDNLTGNDVDLLANPSYSFNAQTTDYASRFRLVFATGSSVDGDNFAFINTMGNLSIFGIEGTATVQVIDLLGHILSSETFSGSYEKKLNVAPGVYMIRLINGDDVKVQKIVVR
jgi:hypothetical protein